MYHCPPTIARINDLTQSRCCHHEPQDHIGRHHIVRQLRHDAMLGMILSGNPTVGQIVSALAETLQRIGSGAMLDPNLSGHRLLLAAGAGNPRGHRHLGSSTREPRPQARAHRNVEHYVVGEPRTDVDPAARFAPTGHGAHSRGHSSDIGPTEPDHFLLGGHAPTVVARDVRATAPHVTVIGRGRREATD